MAYACVCRALTESDIKEIVMDMEVFKYPTIWESMSIGAKINRVLDHDSACNSNRKDCGKCVMRLKSLTQGEW